MDALADVLNVTRISGSVLAHVALNVLTNYFNRVAQPVIDFPEVTPRMAEAA